MTQTPPPKKEEKVRAAESSYPASAAAKSAFSAMGVQYEDTEIGRAWARMFDKGLHLGPAVSDAEKTADGSTEVQHFTGVSASRVLSPENVNKTVQFFDARGLVGEESGL